MHSSSPSKNISSLAFGAALAKPVVPAFSSKLIVILSENNPEKTFSVGLICGPSGCGKSSLLRAIVGLWDAGTGTIIRPPLDRMLFLPQRPYMVLGTLRDQLLYPNLDLKVDDLQLKEILIRVNLADLAQRHNGFDTEQNWSQVLSLGEQQRLIFARLLLNQPKYAILDEATSALDANNEAHLYQELQTSGMTFLSVGHRESLNNYHQSILDLTAVNATTKSAHRTWVITTADLPQLET